MSGQTAWTVGAAPECDVVVDEPAVSGRHCRLVRTEGAGDWIVIDLGSTNGTFVNGERITAPRRVTPSDRITLGHNVPLPWPQRTLRIGRGAGNDVVLDHPAVSGEHARLVVRGEAMEIEDLGSTNGTAVNHRERKVQRSAVTRSDTVYFGDCGVSVARLLGETAGPPPYAPRTSPPTVAPPPDAPSPYVTRPGAEQATADSRLAEVFRSFMRLDPSQRLWIVAGSATAVLIGLLLWFHEPPAATQTTPTDVAAAGEVDGAGTEPVDAPGRPAEAGVGPLAPASASAMPWRANFFQVLVGSATDDHAFRLGTAWAVDDRHLATSAGVIQAAELLRERFPVVQARPAAGANGANGASGMNGANAAWPVLSMRVHPRYRDAARRVDEWRARSDALRSRLADEQSLEGAELEKLIDEAVEAEESWFLAMEERTHFDVGLLEVRPSPVPAPRPGLPLASGETPAVGAALELVGLPFPGDDVLARTTEPPTIERRAGHLSATPKLPESSPEVMRLLIRGEQLDGATNWSGSPVLDGQGRVVAIYSRPTPPLKPGDPPPPDRYDAALVQRLHELLAHEP